jgi:hypothetical protein
LSIVDAAHLSFIFVVLDQPIGSAHYTTHRHSSFD